MDISVEDPLSTVSLLERTAADSSTQPLPTAAGGPHRDAPTKKPKRQRPRQQLSCAACHARKQKCDQQIPCGRCIKRGVASECYIQPATTAKPTKPASGSPQSDHAHSSESPGSAPSPEDVPQLLARIARLESALRKATLNGGGPDESHARSSIADSEDDETESAAATLSELSRPSDLNTTASSWHGGGTFTGMLARQTDEGPPLLPTTPSQSAAQFVLAFPPRALCDFLLDLLYSPHIGGLLMSHLAIPKNFILPTYGHLMTWIEGLALVPGIAPPPAPCSLSFIALINSIFALALQFLPTESYAFVEGFAPRRGELEDALGVQAKAALDKSEADEPPDLWRLQALLMVGIRTKTKGRPSQNYALVSVAIRYAQSMGLHRAPSLASKLTPFEREVRVRVWNALYGYDRGSSFAFGRPHIVNDVHCDCPIPANVDLDVLDPSDPAPLVPIPLEQPTPWTCRILEIKLAKLLGQIADRLYSPRAHTYSDVLDCDRQLLEFEQALPRSFTTPTYEELEKAPYLIQHCRRINLQLIWYRSVLHRGYLLRAIPAAGQPDRYSRSRLAAVTLSTKMISYQRDIVLTLTRVQQRFFLFPFLLFDSAANLCMASLQSRTKQLAEELDVWIVAAQEMLQSMGPDNVVACEGLICIRALRAQIGRAVPDATLAPIDHDAPTDPVVPYIGGTLNLPGKLDLPPLNEIPDLSFDQSAGGNSRFTGFGAIFDSMGLSKTDSTANEGQAQGAALPASLDELASWAAPQPFEQAWTSEEAAYEWPFGNHNLEQGWHTDTSSVLPNNTQSWWNGPAGTDALAR